MKKIVLSLIVLVAVVAVVVCIPQKQSNADFLRIHIRADSNSQSDQSVKYSVKAAVVDYLTPLLASATTKDAAIKVVSDNLSQIQDVCNSTLAQNGKNYLATVKLTQESFPDRTYNGTTLPAGIYDALIIELGSGLGNNWWCVVYPPLCFVEGTTCGTTNIIYRSKLLQIIQAWRQSHS